MSLQSPLLIEEVSLFSALGLCEAHLFMSIQHNICGFLNKVLYGRNMFFSFLPSLPPRFLSASCPSCSFLLPSPPSLLLLLPLSFSSSLLREDREDSPDRGVHGGDRGARSEAPPHRGGHTWIRRRHQQPGLVCYPPSSSFSSMIWNSTSICH